MGVLDDAIREHLELKRLHGAAEEEVRRQEEEALGPARRDVAPAEAGDGAATAEAAEGELQVADQVPPEAPTQLHDAGAESEHSEEAEPSLEPEHPLEPEPSLDAESTEEPELAVEPEPPLEPEPSLEAEPQPNTERSFEAPPSESVESAPTALDEPAGDLESLEPKADHPPSEPTFAPHSPEHGPAAPGDTPPRGFEAFDDDDELLEEKEGEPHAEGDEGDEEDADVLEDTPDFLQETPEHDRLWFEQKPPRDFDFD